MPSIYPQSDYAVITYYIKDSVKSSNYIKKRFRIITLQQEALRVPFRDDFEGL